MKVYNKSLLPIVWRRDHRGTMAIQPGKFNEISENRAEDIIKRFPGACSEEDFLKAKAGKTERKEEFKKAEK